MLAELAGAVRKGRVSAKELVELAYGRIARLNGDLNAVIALRPEEEAVTEAEKRQASASESDGPLPLLGLGDGLLLGPKRDHRVQVPVQPCDPPVRELDELLRRHTSLAHRPRQLSEHLGTASDPQAVHDGSPLVVAEHDPGRVSPRHGHDTTTRMGSGAAQVQARDRRPVVAVEGDGPK